MTDDNRSYPARPIVGVGTVVFDTAIEHVLMVRRGKEPGLGLWTIPGGAQHVGETVEQAAAREVAEETGITPRILHLAGVFNHIDRDAEGRVRHHYTLVDFAGMSEMSPPVAGDDAAHAEWIPFERAVTLPSWTETTDLIRSVRDSLRKTEA